MEDLWFASASEIARRITGRSVTAVEVAEAFLKHIAVHDRLLNSFLNVMTDQALDAAQRVDDALRAGRPPGPLAGVPVAVKDLIDIAGMPTTVGAHRRFHTMAREDAPLIDRNGNTQPNPPSQGVITFPKTATGADPLTGAPAPVDPRQLRELGLRPQGDDKPRGA